MNFLLFFIFIFSGHAYANAASLHKDKRLWKKINEKNGMQIFIRKEKGSKIFGFKIEGILNAPIENIVAALRNVERSPEWTPGLITKITLDNISDTEAITYSINKMPWPVTKRELVLHNKLFINKKEKLLFVITKSIKFAARPINKKYVRAHVGYSNMGVRPLGIRSTYFEWTLFATPRGWVPSWLVNFYQRKFPLKFLKRLEKRANEKGHQLNKGLQEKIKELRKLINNG